MTNREWLLNKMQNMSDEELFKLIKKPCYKIDEAIDCDKMKKEINTSIITCDMCIKHWLNKEHKEKITLSEAERIILENVPEGYEWIARDSDKEIRVFSSKPSKDDCNFWNSGTGFERLSAFNHLFKFVTWNDEQAYNIAELLNKTTC